jgi:hypothetical protein
MGMNREGQFGFNASPLDQFSQASDCEWCTALRNEDKRRLGLTPQGPQCSQLIAQQRMRCGCPTLGSAEVKAAGLKFNVAPLQPTNLTGSEPMPKGHQEHRAVALPPTIALGGLDQLLDLTLGQMLPWSQLSIGPPSRRNCPIYFAWRHQLQIFCPCD